MAMVQRNGLIKNLFNGDLIITSLGFCTRHNMDLDRFAPQMYCRQTRAFVTTPGRGGIIVVILVFFPFLKLVSEVVPIVTIRTRTLIAMIVDAVRVDVDVLDVIIAIAVIIAGQLPARGPENLSQGV